MAFPEPVLAFVKQIDFYEIVVELINITFSNALDVAGISNTGM